MLLLVPFAAIATLAAETPPAAAQAAAPLSFEVATVKVMDAKKPHPASVRIVGDQFEATGMTLKELIKIAYDLNYGADHQISGGPDWIGSTRFDVEAKEDPAFGMALQKMTEEQRGDRLRQMLRGLLGERFKLQIHHGSAELPIYDLVKAKGGSKLMPAVERPTPPTQERSAKPRSSIRFAGRGVIEGNDADAPMLITILSMQPEIGGRLVVDKTGLAGKYDFTLRWTPDIGQGSEQPAPDAGPSLFTALQEELGLRLESTKAPVDVLIIDHVEMPVEN
ncbi:MAG TPA: TIGR03435 family protein [Acidobacteriaceae bacterium]